MADISQINLPDGSSVNIKDATARSDKMDKTNPTGTGSFSLNRKAETTVGNYSSTEGYDNTASGSYSHAEGQGTTASGNNGSHAEGRQTTASGLQSHAEGYATTAAGGYSHAEGSATQTGLTALASHAEGSSTTASGANSHAEGEGTTASGKDSHAGGHGTIAKNLSQHVFGEFNVEDPANKSSTAKGTYIEIVGNGTSTNARSNARTLDWSGNETLAGGLTASGNIDVKDGNGNTKVSLNSSTGDISCTSVNGVTPTEVVANPTDAGSADLTKIQIGNNIYDIPQGGGGSGGHTIVDDAGTSLTQRTNLQFNGAYSEDNSTDNTTEVNIAREMTKAQFNLLSDAEKVGFINVIDETGSGSDIINERIYQGTGSSNANEINLSNPYTLYDFIIIRSLRDADSQTYTLDEIYNCKNLNTNAIIQAFGWSPSNNYWAYTITNASKFTLNMTGSGFYLYEIYGIKIGANSLHEYSEDEQIVGKWIDGSTIYEKTFNIGTQSDQDQSYDHNINNFGALIDIKGSCTQSTGDILPMPYVGLDSYSWAVALGNVTSTQFRIQKGHSMGTLSNVVVTMRYTKSSS